MGHSRIMKGLAAVVLVGLLPACAFIRDFDEFDFSGDSDGATDRDASADADPCALAPCECSDDTDCTEPFQHCDLTPPGSRCACVKGYTLEMVEVPVDGGVPDGGATDGGVHDGGGPEPEYEEACVWSGIVKDPGFDDPTAWTPLRGAAIVTPGTASFAEPAACDLGSLSQEICVPALAEAGPLQVEVSYRSSSTGYLGAAVGFGGFWNELPDAPLSGDWVSRRACLGERAHGQTLELSVAPNRIPWDCSAGLWVRHMDIVPAADTCPAPGTVRNGDFEADDGWSMSFGSIEEGVGQDGSRALSLQPNTQIQEARGTGTASWPMPDTVPSPALRFWSEGTAGRYMHVELDGVGWQIARVRSKGAPMIATVCLPSWAHGLATDLTFELTTSGSGSGDPDDGYLHIDDVTVVSEDACVADPYVLNGGFEQQAEGLVAGWVLFAYTHAKAELISDAEEARTGEGVLRLEATGNQYNGWAQQTIRVPEPDGDDGPAVRFWYRTPGQDNSRFHYWFQGSWGSALPAAGHWTERVECLPPVLATRPASVGFQIRAGSGSYSAERTYVDDVEVITHPDCPAE